MDKINILFEPVIFYSLLAVFFAVFMFVIKAVIRQNKEKDKDGLEEIAKLKQELLIKNQMYEGLKGQYDELERDLERLTQEIEEQKKTKAETQTQNLPAQKESKEETRPKKILEIPSDISIFFKPEPQKQNNPS